MTDLIHAVRQRLCDGGFTCVVLSDEQDYVSYERGVRPLLSLLESERSYRGAVAADKTVGAGAAYLYVLLGVRAVWANVISEAARQILQTHGIVVHYGACVPHIINRQGNGICPIETAVAEAQTAEEAHRLILEALARLSS